MTAYLTRVVTFSSAHRYSRPEWSDERNQATFGACANPHGHGHNYTLEVMVAGEPDPHTGFSVDLRALDDVLRLEVLGPLDHQHLNFALPDFASGGQIPTTENLVIWIWKRLVDRIPNARLVRLRLREDDRLFVDYFGSSSDTSRGGGRPPALT